MGREGGVGLLTPPFHTPPQPGEHGPVSPLELPYLRPGIHIAAPTTER